MLPVESTDKPLTESLGLSKAAEKAVESGSLTGLREAKAAEKAKLQAKAAAPVVEPDDATAGETRKTREQKEQDRINERIRSGIEAETASLKAEIARLKQPADTTRAAVETQQTTTVDDDSLEYYSALPNFPTAAKWQADGKSYEQLLFDQNKFINKIREDRATARRTQDDRIKSTAERERTRGERFSKAMLADADIAAANKVWIETGQFPTNHPIRQDVMLLKPFASLKPNEAPSIRNAIAEEILESENPLALARALSSPGELERLSALTDARSMIREIALIEKSIAVGRPLPKTETSAPPVETSLTAARATDRRDPLDVAVANKDGRAYKELRTEQRLRKLGLRK